MAIRRSQSTDWKNSYLLSLVHLERGDYAEALSLLEGLQVAGAPTEQVRRMTDVARHNLQRTRKQLRFLLCSYGLIQLPDLLGRLQVVFKSPRKHLC